MTKDELSKWAKVMGKRGGEERAKKLTAKRRREIAIKAVRAREAKRNKK